MLTFGRTLKYTPAAMLALSPVFGVLVLLAFCSTYRVWSFGEWRVYRAMGRECHPVWQDYHFGRIRAGDSVEDVIARTAPGKVERKGRWVILHYSEGAETGGISFTGLTAIGYDGRLVHASAYSCGWVRLFFDEMTDEQSREIFGRAKERPEAFRQSAGLLRIGAAVGSPLGRLLACP